MSTAITNCVHPTGGKLNDVGPYIDGNDNIYVVGETNSATDAPGVFKSTDDGDTWSEIDTGNRPTAHTQGLDAIGAFQDGTVIHVATVSPAYSSGMSTVLDVEYHTFNTSDAGSNPDTWQITNEAVSTPSSTGSFVPSVDVAVRSDGDVIIVHFVSPESVMGTDYQRIGYSRREGGSWTDDISITDTGVEGNYGLPHCVLGSSDSIHIVYSLADPPSSTSYAVTLDSSNNLSTPVTWRYGGSYAKPISYLDGSTQRVITANKNFSDVYSSFHWVEDGSGDISSPSSAQNIETTTQNTNSPSLVYVSPDDETYFTYADTSFTIYYESRTGHTGTWGNRTLLYTGSGITNHHSAQYHSAPDRVGWVHCDHGSSPTLQLYYVALELGAAEPEFLAELASESDVAFDVALTDPNIFFADSASESDIAVDAFLEAGLGFYVDQAFESNTAFDVDLFTGVVPPDNFVVFATGNAGVLLESTNGIDWAIRDIGYTRTLHEVVWSSALELWVMGISDDGVDTFVLTSSDGFTWDETVVDDTIDLRSTEVVWSPQEAIFAIIAQARVYTSSDGTTWTRETLARSSLLGDLIWASNIDLFILGQDVFESNLTQGIQTSPDGATWTERGPSSYNSFYGAAAWSPDIDLAVMWDTVGDFVYTSPNGTSWTYRGQFDDVGAVTWGGGDAQIFVSVGPDGYILTSPNGISWSTQTSPTSEGLGGVNWIPELELLIAVGLNGTIITSPDGINWTERTSPTSVTLSYVAGGISVKSEFEVELANESDVAFDVNMTTTLGELLIENASESDVALDVELATDDVILLTPSISMQLDLTASIDVTEVQPAKGLGVPKSGDHKPFVYRRDRKIVRR